MHSTSNSKEITKTQIKDTLIKSQRTLKKYKVKSIGIFGSYVKGRERKDSDIDFLVEFDEGKFGKNFEGYFDAYIGLLFALEKIFKRKIDLLTIRMISPYIKPYILKEVEYIEEV